MRLALQRQETSIQNIKIRAAFPFLLVQPFRLHSAAGKRECWIQWAEYPTSAQSKSESGSTKIKIQLKNLWNKFIRHQSALGKRDFGSDCGNSQPVKLSFLLARFCDDETEVWTKVKAHHRQTGRQKAMSQLHLSWLWGFPTPSPPRPKTSSHPLRLRLCLWLSLSFYFVNLSVFFTFSRLNSVFLLCITLKVM